jgi:pimeloyl-ACP methyl ester carboxylesterase
MPDAAMPDRVRGRTSSGMVFESRGSGQPIVLLHGWCLNRRVWLYAEEALCAAHRVITPDFAGFGLSDDLAGPYEVGRYADDVSELLSELELTNVILVGFALGATVALELGARSDERVAGIVSIGVPSAACSPYDKMARAMRRDWPDFARRSAQALFHNQQSEATLHWLERMFGAAPLPVALETVAVLARYEPGSTVKKIEAPVLFIHADHDTVAPISLGRACAESATNGRLEIVQDCGHLIVLDQKERLHELVETFVRSL